MKRAIPIGLGLFVSTVGVFANGGGYQRGGAVGGDVAGFEPKATENVRILDEQLTARVGPEAAEVEVRYLMRNETAKKVKVRFGFPVDETPGDEAIREDGTFVPPSGVPRHCQNYQLTAGGQAVKAKWEPEPKPKAGTPPDKRLAGLRGWFVSELVFAANEEKPVLIRFRSGYAQSGFHVSDNGTMSRAVLTYRLSTGACWGGSIARGRVVLKPVGIDPAELKVLGPVNRFRKEGESWVWNFENLEPTLADDIQAEVEPEVKSFSGEGRLNHERNGRWYYTSTDYTAKASSVLPPQDGKTYGPENLTEHPGVWSEGAPGPGAGEWLEIRPKSAKPLLALALSPGFQKSPGLFQANARPKKVTMILNGEHKVHAEIPDAPVTCRIPAGGYDKPVKTIRLVFDEVWPGTKFEDLCLSGLWLEVKLAKKPKESPVR
ncbi:MAG: hypothetical protein J0M04_01625 [Verrucomicrobia bacterium]|nr:hypothetical protein [Verrucomicrobiota bacterium]